MTEEVIEVQPEAELDTTAPTEPPTEEAKADEVETPADEKKFTQKELDEIIQKRIVKEAARAERRALKVYAEKLERMSQPAQQQEPQRSDNGKPTSDQYRNVDDYVEALTEWKLGQKEAESKRASEQAQSKQLLTKVEKVYAEAEKISGFDRASFDAMFDELPKDAQTNIAMTILESDIPGKILAHLHANPDVAEKLAELSPTRQAAEIGKLEAKLSTVSVTKSKAPAPISPIGSRGGSASGDLARMSMEDYVAARAKQGARWAGRR